MSKNLSLDNTPRLARVTAAEAKSVSPSDSTDLPNIAQAGLWVIATGNVKFKDAQGNDVTLTAVPAFTRIPIAASRVYLTGTSATVLALS